MSTLQQIPEFKYVAVRGKERVTGTMAASSANDVAASLASSGMTAVDVQQVKAELNYRNLIQNIRGGGPKLNMRTQADVATSIHQMMAAGLGAQEAMNVLASGETKQPIADMYNEIGSRIRSGERLSAAFAGFPRAFDDVFLSYLEAGERAGTTEESLRDLADLLNRRAALVSRIKGVTAYPRLVMGLTFLLAGGVILFIVPRFTALFEDFGAELPLPTQILLAFSENFLPYTIGFAVVTWLTIRGIKKKSVADPEFGVMMDKLKFRMPVFGKLMHRLALYRWSATLGGALDSGVQTSIAVDLASRSSGSAWLKSVSDEIQQATRDGAPLTAPIANHPDLIPPKLRQMILSGQKAGNVEQMLKHISRTISEDIDQDAETLEARLSTALIVTMSVVLGTIIIALYLPILLLTTTVAEGLGF